MTRPRGVGDDCPAIFRGDTRRLGDRVITVAIDADRLCPEAGDRFYTFVADAGMHEYHCFRADEFGPLRHRTAVIAISGATERHLRCYRLNRRHMEFGDVNWAVM